MRKVISGFIISVGLISAQQSEEPDYLDQLVAAVPDAPPFQEETHKPIDKGNVIWLTSTGILLGCTTADAISSLGKHEANALLRNSAGTFGAKGLAVKYGVTGAMLGAEFLLRKNHKMRKAMTFANLGDAALYCGTAIHNGGIAR